MTRVLKVVATVRQESTTSVAKTVVLLVSLSAMLDAGRRIDQNDAFGMSGPFAGLQDIERGINRMLGRDFSLHRPSRAALELGVWLRARGPWNDLIAALAPEGIEVDENELIEAPLTVELDDEVAAALKAE